MPLSAAPERPTTATVELRNINFAVNAAGEIAPAEQVSVRPEINGKVDHLPVDLGDHLKKGDLLFKLDDKELQQQRASNVTDIDKAKLNLEKAERDYKRAQQLLADKLISQEAYDDTKTAYDLAKNALESAQRALAIIDEHLTKTEVRAPFDCTVLTRPVSIGQAVSGSDGFNGGTEVLTIADLNAMIINAQVNQADVPRLKVGETVEVTVEAVAGLRATGTVERISPQAIIKNNIKGYPARIVLKNVDQRIRPGMTANVKIPVASADNVTAVPLSAVFTEKNPDTGQMERFVYVQQGETASRSATSRWASPITSTPKYRRASRRAKSSRWSCPRRSARRRRSNWPSRRRAAARPAAAARKPPRSGQRHGHQQAAGPLLPAVSASDTRAESAGRPSPVSARSHQQHRPLIQLTVHASRFTLHVSHVPRRTPQRQQDLSPRRGGNPRPGRRDAGHRGGRVHLHHRPVRERQVHA